jgi:hypothetical protein
MGAERGFSVVPIVVACFSQVCECADARAGDHTVISARGPSPLRPSAAASRRCALDVVPKGVAHAGATRAPTRSRRIGRGSPVARSTAGDARTSIGDERSASTGPADIRAARITVIRTVAPPRAGGARAARNEDSGMDRCAGISLGGVSVAYEKGSCGTPGAKPTPGHRLEWSEREDSNLRPLVPQAGRHHWF